MNRRAFIGAISVMAVAAVLKGRTLDARVHQIEERLLETMRDVYAQGGSPHYFLAPENVWELKHNGKTIAARPISNAEFYRSDFGS